eukprot:scaffold219439_cov26-Tisochrysis_lutea.AAC.1
MVAPDAPCSTKDVDDEGRAAVAQSLWTDSAAQAAEAATLEAAGTAHESASASGAVSKTRDSRARPDAVSSTAGAILLPLE